MSATRNPKASLAIAILALIGAALLAGCGGGSSSGTTSGEGSPPAEAPSATTESKQEGGSEAGAGGAEIAAGKEVFSTNCGSCHTLKAAGTSGTIGPNLDELMPSASTVEHQVINGGGAMPAFGKNGILKGKEIKDVAAYVSAEAGK